MCQYFKIACSLRLFTPTCQFIFNMFYIIFVTLCNTFQAHWQWIFKGANGIEKKDKAKLLQMMRRLLYIQTEEDFNVALCDMQEDSTYLKYPNYQNHRILQPEMHRHSKQ